MRRSVLGLRLQNAVPAKPVSAALKKQYDEMEALVKEHGYEILGEQDAHHCRRMKDFCRNVGDILATVADILQPRSFDELVQYGFDA